MSNRVADPAQRLFRRCSPSWLVALAAVELAGCGGDGPPTSGASEPPASIDVPAVMASSTLDLVRSRLPAARSLLARAAAAGVEAAHPLDVELWNGSRAGMTLREKAAGISLEISLEGGDAGAVGAEDGFIVHAAVLDGAAESFARALPEGAEDFVYLRERPRVTQLEYALTLGPAVAGLRLVEGVLEILDAGGAPRLRAVPPYVVDVTGRHPAELEIDGCAVDRSPVVPWRRPVLSPGARSCTLRVNWGEEVAYPALVDPAWSVTGNMTSVRSHPVGTLLSANEALVAGGATTRVGGLKLSSAEVYSLAAGAWAVTESMAKARDFWRGAKMGNGKVLTVGGTSSANDPPEIYDPATGTWSLAAMSPPGIHGLGGVTLLDGKVLYAENAAAALYDPAAATWSAIPPMIVPRLNYGRTRLADGRVLIAGGIVPPNNAPTASAEIYDPATGSWSSTTSMNTARGFAVVRLLPNGKVFVMVEAGVNDVYDPATATWTAGPKSSTVRIESSYSVLLDGRVLVTGGFIPQPNSQLATKTTEIYDPVAQLWSPGSPTIRGYVGHFEVTFPGGDVLVAGGDTSVSSFALATANSDLYGAAASACASPADCADGFCADGFCCNTACSAGACDACSVAAGAAVNGTCALLTGIPCSDGDACTSNDTCMSGVCAGANPVVCNALDQCHVAGLCDPATGMCASPQKADGSPCDDGDACTQTDSCQAGVCTGANALPCPALDACHEAGECNPATGMCSSPAKADGTACPGGSCMAGVCVEIDGGTAAGGGGSSTTTTSLGRRRRELDHDHDIHRFGRRRRELDHDHDIHRCGFGR